MAARAAQVAEPSPITCPHSLQCVSLTTGPHHSCSLQNASPSTRAVTGHGHYQLRPHRPPSCDGEQEVEEPVTWPSQGQLQSRDHEPKAHSALQKKVEHFTPQSDPLWHLCSAGRYPRGQPRCPGGRSFANPVAWQGQLNRAKYTGISLSLYYVITLSWDMPFPDGASMPSLGPRIIRTRDGNSPISVYFLD